MIDWTKPLETTSGLPARWAHDCLPYDGDREFFQHLLVFVEDTGQEFAGWFNAEGQEVDDDFVLRNVAE